MIELNDLLAQIWPLAVQQTVGIEQVELKQALGRVLAQDVISTLNVPQHDNSGMDGYAVRFADAVGPWTVIGESAAGKQFAGTVGAGEAVRIFTGAPVPTGATRVIIQEDVDRHGDQITVTACKDNEAEAEGVQLSLRTCEVDVIQIEPRFMARAVINLLRNALHYTEQGFIRLTLLPTGFLVEDSGVGIPEEKREAMFEPFVRGNEQRGEGLGLGLSLVQRICENQGWTVSLSHMEPNGCRFHVELTLSHP